jgi:hypothetical protein
MDRSATTWSVLNGLTMNCVQCHSHPYDPIHHNEYYKSLAFFNTTLDADYPSDVPVLRVPKDRSRYPEAAQLQQEIALLTRSLVDQGRSLEAQTGWIPVTITSATASEAPALRWEIVQLERQLSELKESHLPGKEPKDKEVKDRQNAIRDLSKVIAEDRTLANVKAKVKPVTFRVGGGELAAASTTPGKSVYEVKLTAPLPSLTALRMELRSWVLSWTKWTHGWSAGTVAKSQSHSAILYQTLKQISRMQ